MLYGGASGYATVEYGGLLGATGAVVVNRATKYVTTLTVKVIETYVGTRLAKTDITISEKKTVLSNKTRRAILTTKQNKSPIV